MNTVRLTSQEKDAMDRGSLLISLPHTMVDFLNKDDSLDWNAFQETHPKLYEEYNELSIEEIDQCLAEIYKSGGYHYCAIVKAFHKQREDIVNMHLQI